MPNQIYINELSTEERCKRSLLRRDLRTKRRNLSHEEQTSAAQKLFLQLKELDEYKLAQKIAIYLAADGEINPSLLVELAHAEGKQCFVPVISDDEKDELIFTEYTLDSELHKNRYLIDEPSIRADNTIEPSMLDTVFMPLVGFDATGTRLGMGKGYYDRCFAFLLDSKHNKPKLVGLAHECQKVGKLQVASWDVPLEKVITDQTIYQAA